MKKLKLTVLSQKDFDKYMVEHGINDDTVSISKKTFVSIIGTKDCLEYYLDEKDTKHHFNHNHCNVMNLDFDDVDTDTEYEGHLFKAMSDHQALQLCLFLELLNSKYSKCDEIIIHCRCGISRSRAVAEYICQTSLREIDYEDRDKYYSHINQCVLRKLKQMYREYVLPQTDKKLSWQDLAKISYKLCKLSKEDTLILCYATHYDYLTRDKIKEKYHFNNECSFLTTIFGDVQCFIISGCDNNHDATYRSDTPFAITNPFEKAISEYFNSLKADLDFDS